MILAPARGGSPQAGVAAPGVFRFQGAAWVQPGQAAPWNGGSSVKTQCQVIGS